MLHNYATSVYVSIVLRRCFIAVLRFCFFNEELVRSEDMKKRTYAGGVDTNHCNQCLCGLAENPTFSVNNSKVCELQLPGNFAAMRQSYIKFLPNGLVYFFITIRFEEE